MDSVQGYVGSELALFAEAVNWKRYLQRQFAPFIRGSVLEVGAGMGGTTCVMRSGDCSHWTCLEPDPSLAEQIVPRMRAAAPERADDLTVVVGTAADLAETSKYDAILYIDVLEHIENDAAELGQAARLLADGGRLIVLSPAHQWLYSPFDESIGHFRRYTRKTLAALSPPGLALRRLRYLDSVGLLASSGNRFLLQSSLPTARQIWVWDSLMVPLSRLLDVAVGYRLGKSIYAVWQRTDNAVGENAVDRDRAKRQAAMCSEAELPKEIARPNASLQVIPAEYSGGALVQSSQRTKIEGGILALARAS